MVPVVLGADRRRDTPALYPLSRPLAVSPPAEGGAEGGDVVYPRLPELSGVAHPTSGRPIDLPIPLRDMQRADAVPVRERVPVKTCRGDAMKRLLAVGGGYWVREEVVR